MEKGSVGVEGKQAGEKHKIIEGKQMTPQKLKKHHKHNIAILHYHLIKPTW